MKRQHKTSRVPLLNTIGALVVLSAVCFQLFAGSVLTSSQDLSDIDSITYVIEKDALVEFAGIEKQEFYQTLAHHPNKVTSVALHLNEGLTNMLGRASVPHSNQLRFILFQNPKLDCLA